MKTIYECSRSKAVNRLTAAGLLIIVSSIIYEMWCITQGMSLLLAIAVTLILLAAFISAFMVYPQYIVATDEGVGVHMLLHTRLVPYSDIDRIVRLDESFLSWRNSVRLLGIGGLLGYIGWFRSKGLGTYHAYVTDRTKAFLIYRKSGKPLAISVSEPEEFMPYYLKGESTAE